LYEFFFFFSNELLFGWHNKCLLALRQIKRANVSICYGSLTPRKIELTQSLDRFLLFYLLERPHKLCHVYIWRVHSAAKSSDNGALWCINPSWLARGIHKYPHNSSREIIYQQKWGSQNFVKILNMSELVKMKFKYTKLYNLICQYFIYFFIH